MKTCKISGNLKLGSNEKGETFVWWPDLEIWLSMEEFKNCEIEPGAKFILQIGLEKIKKDVLSNSNHLSTSSFVDNNDYSLSPGPLKFEDFGVLHIQDFIYEEIQQPITESIIAPVSDTTSISDLFIGCAASMALLMSVIQQVRQKKKEAESNLCCNNNKIAISKFDAKLQKLETELKTKAEKDNKGFIAEMLETRKELKDIKDDFDEITDIIEKIIDKNKKG